MDAQRKPKRKPKRNLCPDCKGSSYAPNGEDDCKTCGGTGVLDYESLER